MRIRVPAVGLALAVVMLLVVFTSAFAQQGVVKSNAILRAGPGTNYAKVGYAPKGTQVQIAACNTGCTWYQLDSGKWIAAWLVDATDDGSCDPSYPTLCIPSSPPDLDCADIPVKSFQVVGDDPHNFDADFDGIGCEPLPTDTSDPDNPPPPNDPPGGCDPNYAGTCIPIVSYDLDCGDVSVKNFQSIGSDPHNFDGDNDGLACEK